MMAAVMLLSVEGAHAAGFSKKGNHEGDARHGVVAVPTEALARFLRDVGMEQHGGAAVSAVEEQAAAHAQEQDVVRQSVGPLNLE